MRGIFSPVKRVSLRKNAAGAIMLLDGVYFYPIINKGAFFMADKNIMSYETVALDEENHALVIIDQTKLPGEVEILHLTEQKDIWQAIYLLQVRGAPAIGVAAGFGLYLAARQIQAEDFDGFKALVEYAGGTSSYTFPEELYYKNEETGELTSFSQGPASRTLWGDDIRRILTYPLYADGEKTKVQAVGELGASIINSGFLTNAEEITNNLTNIFNTIFNNSDTDITSRSFKEVKPAYEHLLEISQSPATYRMPKGTWGDNGYFSVDTEFKTEIKEYFELIEQE